MTHSHTQQATQSTDWALARACKVPIGGVQFTSRVNCVGCVPLPPQAPELRAIRERELTFDVGVEVRSASAAVGLGLFATRDLAMGELLLEYAGDRHPPGAHFCNAEASYVWDLLKGGSISAFNQGNAARFMNHFAGLSPAPNVTGYKVLELDGWHVFFQTNTLVSMGQQLLIDYGPQYSNFEFPVQRAVFLLIGFLIAHASTLNCASHVLCCVSGRSRVRSAPVP